MPYLTYEEYSELGFVELDETEFDKLIRKASDVLDDVTRFFYRFNVLEDDMKFRRDQFKKALAAQIEYFNDMGATNSHSMNEANSVTIGRTTVSKGSRNSGPDDTEEKKLISKDAYMYLSSTGLLYRGLGVRS